MDIRNFDIKSVFSKSLVNNNQTANRFIFLLVNVLIAGLVGGFSGFYSYQLAGSGAVSGGSTFVRKDIVQNQVLSEDQLVTNVAKNSSPAVVSIVASKDLQVFQQNAQSPFQGFCNDPFFRQFFDPAECAPTGQPTPAPKTQKQQVSAGSGFIVRSDGLIVTNKHVVDVGQADFTVITNTGKSYPAQILAKDTLNDLAVLKINANNLPTLKLGDSSKLEIGQSVVAIGNALGQFSNTVSRGVVSGLSRSIVASAGASSEKLDQLIQTDAAINPGNSGGPLLNLAGEVMGINTAVAQGAQNIGFAIPVNQIKRAIGQVSTLGRIVYPYLGVRYTMITPELKQAKNLASDQGAWISGDDKNPAIVANSPAAKAGLQAGDIILELNGKTLNLDNDLAKAIQELPVGQRVNIKVLRSGQTLTLTLVLEEKK